MSTTIVIEGRFNGPRQSGNGGYSAGVLAGLIDGPAQVTLRNPIPLDTGLEVVRFSDRSVQLRRSTTLIAVAHPTPQLEVDVPDRVDTDQARLAAGRYTGGLAGLFDDCFVCSLSRDDTLGVFAGPVTGRQLVASPWTPPAWIADDAGRVLPEFVWAVLDCPTYFASYVTDKLRMSLLARFSARIDAPVIAGREYVLIAWPIAVDGRKRWAGSAVLSAGGETVAAARALLIEPRSQAQPPPVGAVTGTNPTGVSGRSGGIKTSGARAEIARFGQDWAAP